MDDYQILNQFAASFMGNQNSKNLTPKDHLNQDKEDLK